MGLVLVSLKKITIEKSLRLGFSATNNKAEYEALLMGMAMVQRMGGNVFELKIGCWPSEWRVGSERRENAGVPKSS